MPAVRLTWVHDYMYILSYLQGIGKRGVLQPTSVHVHSGEVCKKVKRLLRPMNSNLTIRLIKGKSVYASQSQCGILVTDSFYVFTIIIYSSSTI